MTKLALSSNAKVIFHYQGGSFQTDNFDCKAELCSIAPCTLNVSKERRFFQEVKGIGPKLITDFSIESSAFCCLPTSSQNLLLLLVSTFKRHWTISTRGGRKSKTLAAHLVLKAALTKMVAKSVI